MRTIDSWARSEKCKLIFHLGGIMKVFYLFTFCMILLANDAWSEMYRYIDENGAMAFTDDITKVPNKSSDANQPTTKTINKGMEFQDKSSGAKQPDNVPINKEIEIQKNLNNLSSPDIQTRITAARELARLHNLNGVRLALKDTEAKVRYAAISALSIMPSDGKGQRDPEAGAIFLTSLKDKDADVKYIALRQLESYSSEAYFQHIDMDPDVCVGIAELLDDPKENIRSQAVGMLKDCRVLSVEEKLLRIADNRKESPRFRETVIWTLAKSKIKGLEDKLINFLKEESEDKGVKRAAVNCLGNMKSTRAVDFIIPYLHDADQQMHYNVVSALGNIGGPKATSALADALMDKTGKVDSSVLESLGKVRSPEVLPKLLKIKPLLSNSNLKTKFIEAIGATGRDEAVASLLEIIIETSDVNVRTAASKALEKFDSRAALKSIVEASKKVKDNDVLFYLAKNAQHKLDFPEETLKEKAKHEEDKLALEQETEINNKIYFTGYRLFRGKKYEKALPYFYEAAEKYEKHYAKYPTRFKSSLNQLGPALGFIAGYYRWIAKDPQKAVAEYTKLINIMTKYESEERRTAPTWFIIGEIYEKDIKDYKKALECYKKYTDSMSIVKDEREKEFEVMMKWHNDWVSYLQERIKVVNLKKQTSFSQRKLRYPSIEYSYFAGFGGPALGFSGFIDEDFMNYAQAYYSVEEFEKLYIKYPNSYQVMFFGTALFHKFLSDNKVNDALNVSEKLFKYYSLDPNIMMLHFELADIYKKQNENQKHKEAMDKALKMAKAMNIEMVFGGDPRFASPEKTWQLFVTSLKKKDIDAALECFAPTSKQKYREVFTALKDKLYEIASGMEPIRLIKKEEGRAEYDILRKENGKVFSYGVYFVDMVGEWKIEQF